MRTAMGRIGAVVLHVATGAVLVPPPAMAWDADLHARLARLGLERCPAPLDELLARRAASLVDAAVGPDSTRASGSLHGPAGARELVELIDSTRRQWQSKEMTPGQLTVRLGTISHLASDLFAPAGELARAGAGRWLDNHTGLASYDGPPSTTDGAALVGEWQRLAALLRSDRELTSLRLDLAFNAVIDAWAVATGSEEHPWGTEGEDVRFGAAWVAGGIVDRAEEDAELRRRRQHDEQERALQRRRDAEFRQMGTYAEYKRELLALEQAKVRSAGDPAGADVEERQRALAAAEAARRKADAEAEEAVAYEKRILAGDLPEEARPVLALLDQSLVARTSELTLLVSVKNQGESEWNGLVATVSDAAGVRGTLRIASRHPPGRIRRYEAHFVTGARVEELSIAYAPMTARVAAPAAVHAGGARATALALVEALASGDPVETLVEPGASVPLVVPGQATTFVAERDTREVVAGRMEEIAALYEELALPLLARAELDPAAMRDGKVGHRLNGIARALRADAARVGSLDEGRLGRTVELKPEGSSADAGVVGIEVVENGRGAWRVRRAVTGWPRSLAEIRSWLEGLAGRAVTGQAWELEIDIRDRLRRDGAVGYDVVEPSPVSEARETAAGDR